ARIVGGHLLRIEHVMPEARRVHLHDDERDAVVRRLHAALRVAVGLGGVVVPARQPAQKLRELTLAQLALVGTGAEQSEDDHRGRGGRARGGAGGRGRGARGSSAVSTGAGRSAAAWVVMPYFAW